MTDASEARASRGPDRARLAAARVLFAVYTQDAYANLSARHLLDQSELDACDRRFAAALIYETISRTISIDYLLAGLSSRPLDRLDPWVLTVLRMGAWQLVWSRSVPAPAAIDTSVRLAASRAGRPAGGFVNAVLRRLDREKPELPARDLALSVSLPSWLFGCLRKWFGQDEALSLGRHALQGVTRISLRVNQLRADPEDLALELAAEPGRYCPEALSLALQGHSVTRLPGWADGRFSVQDEAAMLVGYAANPKPGWTIVDLCSAPGGKACHLAERTGDAARIVAADLHAGRLQLVRDQADRLGLSSVTTRQADAATGRDGQGGEAFADLAGQADLVIADVPCSGLGLLGRKPEIRLHMTYERMQAFLPLQAAILDTADKLLKPGGVLVYSTCTLNPAENQEQVAAFLDRRLGCYRPEPLNGLLPGAVLAHPDLARQSGLGQLQMLPHRHETDGFFIARLRKD